MLFYAINAALESKIFDRIVVSTDGVEIQHLAKNLGAECESLRPAELSDDFATTLDVISFEVRNLGLKNDDIICCIYPTVPLLKAQSLRAGLHNLKKGAYCFSACAFNANPLRGFYIKNEQLHLLKDEFMDARSQDLEKIYYDCGQFYFGYGSEFLAKKPIFSADSNLIILPEIAVCDINNEDDWKIAEIKYKICMQ